MPSLDEHCARSIEMFGNEFREVHEWLDEFAGKPPHGMRHRHLRHHMEGVRRVSELFGVQAAEAAIFHIIYDLEQEGWTDDDDFPVDSLHYKRMGLF